MTVPTLDEHHRHEALDRCSMLMDMLETHLLDHVYTDAHEKVRAHVISAINSLSRAYEAIAKGHI